MTFFSAAAAEIEQARSRLGGTGELLLGSEATESSLLEAVARGARIVHLATHTVIDQTLGRGAAILLTPTETADGLVYPDELAGGPWNADLTVLAACSTALGDGSGARGLGSLYVHSNDITMKEARDFHVDWTPRGWMREDLDLLGFEQLLYLRQPGYGTSYITGKYLIERLLAERARQLGDEFTLKGFYNDLDEAGVIPVSLVRWQLLGDDREIRELMGEEIPNRP